MKTIPLIALIASIACLKANQPFITNPTKLNPDAVKSPGGFNNVAPEASKIITPMYASLLITRTKSEC